MPEYCPLPDWEKDLLPNTLLLSISWQCLWWGGGLEEKSHDLIWWIFLMCSSKGLLPKTKDPPCVRHQKAEHQTPALTVSIQKTLVLNWNHYQVSGFQKAMAVLGKSDRALLLCVRIFILSSEKYRTLQPSLVEVALGTAMRIYLTYVKCRSLSLFTTTVMSLIATPDRQLYRWKEDKKGPLLQLELWQISSMSHCW